MLMAIAANTRDASRETPVGYRDDQTPQVDTHVKAAAGGIS